MLLQHLFEPQVVYPAWQSQLPIVSSTHSFSLGQQTLPQTFEAPLLSFAQHVPSGIHASSLLLQHSLAVPPHTVALLRSQHLFCVGPAQVIVPTGVETKDGMADGLIKLVPVSQQLVPQLIPDSQQDVPRQLPGGTQHVPSPQLVPLIVPSHVWLLNPIGVQTITA